jgi:hypothetical protein
MSRKTSVIKPSSNKKVGRPKKESESVEIEKEIKVEKLTSDDEIDVMSLSLAPLTLTTQKWERGGGGIEYNFKSFGDVQPIVYSHLASIISAHRSFAEKPYFYIMDKRVVQRHGLNEIYSKCLNKEQIESVLECSSFNAIKLFQSAPKSQQDLIVEILTKKIFDGQNVDLNIVDGISREAGVDILEKVKVSKEMTRVEEDDEE